MGAGSLPSSRAPRPQRGEPPPSGSPGEGAAPLASFPRAALAGPAWARVGGGLVAPGTLRHCSALSTDCTATWCSPWHSDFEWVLAVPALAPHNPVARSSRSLAPAHSNPVLLHILVLHTPVGLAASISLLAPSRSDPHPATPAILTSQPPL